MNNFQEKDTLTIFVHILGMYLSDPSGVNNQTSQTTSSGIEFLRRSADLNEFVIKKIINLGVSYKQELKSILDKWPSLKLKIGNALKSSTQASTGGSGANYSQSTGPGRLNPQQLQSQQQANKTPKIQLNFNFSKK
jgi:hypothetical protein